MHVTQNDLHQAVFLYNNNSAKKVINEKILRTINKYDLTFLKIYKNILLGKCHVSLYL